MRRSNANSSVTISISNSIHDAQIHVYKIHKMFIIKYRRIFYINFEPITETVWIACLHSAETLPAAKILVPF